MQFKYGDQECRLVFTDRMPKDEYGSVSPPGRTRVIRIRKSKLSERQTLETVLHELVHLLDWDVEEAAVERRARLLAKVLWRLGYRRPTC